MNVRVISPSRNFVNSRRQVCTSQNVSNKLMLVKHEVSEPYIVIASCPQAHCMQRLYRLRPINRCKKASQYLEDAIAAVHDRYIHLTRIHTYLHTRYVTTTIVTAERERERELPCESASAIRQGYVNVCSVSRVRSHI